MMIPMTPVIPQPPVDLTSGAHRISLDEVPGRRREQRGPTILPPQVSAARHEHHVGAGRGVLKDTRVIRQLLPHFLAGEVIRRSLLVAFASAVASRGLSWGSLVIFWGLARARPRDVRAPLRTTPFRPRALKRRCNTFIGCTENSFFRTARAPCPTEVQAVPAGYTKSSRTSYYFGRA